MPQSLSLNATKRGLIASTPSQMSLRLSMGGSRSLRMECFTSFAEPRLAVAAASANQPARSRFTTPTLLDSPLRLLVKYLTRLLAAAHEAQASSKTPHDGNASC